MQGRESSRIGDVLCLFFVSVWIGLGIVPTCSSVVCSVGPPILVLRLVCDFLECRSRAPTAGLY
jgi:hypothetical protein